MVVYVRRRPNLQWHSRLAMTPARLQSTAHRRLALLLALLVGLHQTALAMHELLHWHPQAHGHAPVSFAPHLFEAAETAHEDDWFEQFVCGASAAGTAPKSAPLASYAVWPSEQPEAFHSSTATKALCACASLELPPARAPPLYPPAYRDIERLCAGVLFV